MSYFDYSTFYLDYKTKKEVLEQINRIRKQVNEIEGVFTGEIEDVVRRVLNEGNVLEDYLLKNEFYNFEDEIINQIDVINNLIDVLDEKFQDYYKKDEVDNLISGIDLSNYYTKSETYNKQEVDQSFIDVSVLLSNYYIKDATYNKQEIDQAIENVKVDLSNYYTKDETYNKQEVDQAIKDASTGYIDLSNYYTKEETYNKSQTDAKISQETKDLAPKIQSTYLQEIKPWNLVEGDFVNMNDIIDDWRMIDTTGEMQHIPGTGIVLPSQGYDVNLKPNLRPFKLRLDHFVGDEVTIYLKGVNPNLPVLTYHITDNQGSIVRTNNKSLDEFADEVYPYDTVYSFTVEENMLNIELEVYGFTLEYVVISNSFNPYYPLWDYVPRLKYDVADQDESVLGRMVYNMKSIMEHIKR